MKTLYRDVACWFIALLIAATSIYPASWNSCNGIAWRPRDYPVGMHVNSCSIPDLESPEGRSAINAIYELRTYGGVTGPLVTPNDACILNHSNGVFEMALVDPSQLDGRLGLTIKKTDGCVLSGDEEHITDADVMVSNALVFDEPDESFVITSSAGTNLGRVVMLHEYGHSVGLEHSSDFAVMRNGLGPRVPFVGANTSGGHVKYVADDVFGIRNIFRLPLDYPNLYVSAQWMQTATNMIRDTAVNPATNNNWASSFNICPNQTFGMYATVGNSSTFSRGSEVRMYADAGAQPCTSLDGVGTELARFSVSMTGYTTYSFPIQLTIPVGIPRNTALRVYTAIDPKNQLHNEARTWDNCARSAVTIIVQGANVCGR